MNLNQQILVVDCVGDRALLDHLAKHHAESLRFHIIQALRKVLSPELADLVVG